MKRFLTTSLLAAALTLTLALTGCGGGGQDAPAPPAAKALPLSADAAPQSPQAAGAWVPGAAGLMEWAELTYPQFFPAGPRDQTSSPYTYRQYPQTGNYLAVAGSDVYLHGPVAGGVLTRVGSLAEFACQIDPAGCQPVQGTGPVVVTVPPTVVPTSVVPGVSVVLNTPRSVSADLLLGQRMPVVSLIGSAVGNLEALAGRTLYILVEDPHGLFEPVPFVTLGGSTVGIQLGGKVQNTPGVLAGNLKVYACLDPQCATALGGSPVLLPYRVTVARGISTDVDSVAVYPGFGEVPAARTVRVSLPADTTQWQPGLVTGSASNYIFVTSSNKRGNVAGEVVVSFAAAPVGTYNAVVRVTAQAYQPGGQELKSFTKDITVTYVVNPNPAVDVVIAPVETVASMKYGDSQGLGGANYFRSAVANTGVTLRLQGIEYVSAPAAAAGHPRLNNWWSDTTFNAGMCQFGYIGNNNFAYNCLPPGTYVARAHYIKTKAGVSSDVYHVIRLQVYP